MRACFAAEEGRTRDRQPFPRRRAGRGLPGVPRVPVREPQRHLRDRRAQALEPSLDPSARPEQAGRFRLGS